MAKGTGYGDAAAGAGTGSLTSLDGDGDHSDYDIFTSAHGEFESNSPSFVRKMSQLMKISAVYLIPPDPLEHLPPDGPLLAERFTCLEKMCTLCGVRYEEMADQPAVAITQVRRPCALGGHGNVDYSNSLMVNVDCNHSNNSNSVLLLSTTIVSFV